MLTGIGIILILAGIALLIVKKYNRQTNTKNEIVRQHNIEQAKVQDTGGYARYKSEISLIPTIKLNHWFIIGGGVIAMLFGVANPIAYNSYGYRTAVENPITSNTWVQFNQGWYIKGPFSDTYVYPNVITNMYSAEEIEEEITSFSGPFEIRFNDATRAEASATVRWRLPNDEVDMLKIHAEYHNPGKLASTTLNKYTRECLKYAAQLMESETHYSGGMSRLSEDFQDQLENGQYIIEYKTEYVTDSVSMERRKLTQTFIRQDETGRPDRNKSDVQQFNIQVAYASVDQVDYEPQVDKKLAEKIAASTKESVSKQELMTAKQEALTATEKGKKLLAETTAREEAAKLESVIRAEKDAAVASENLKRDEFNAKAKLVLKKAEAEGDKLKVLAGLSPKEQAEYDMKTAIGVAEALAGPQGIVFPKIVSTNSGQSGSSGALQTLELKMLNDLVKEMSNKN